MPSLSGHNPNHVLRSVYLKKAPLTIIKKPAEGRETKPAMIPRAQWYWASNIYRNVYKFQWRKRRKNFPLHHLVRISVLDDAFSKILELTGNWQLAVNWQLATAAKWQKQEEKEKRKKGEKSKEIGFDRLFGMPVPKNATKRDAIAKKGMLSCLILSSLDS